MTRARALLGFLSLLPALVGLIVGCAGTRGRGELPNWREQGLASWYGADFHGRRTANGERYNMYAMTAAHKTLPLGTQIVVINQQDRPADPGEGERPGTVRRGPHRRPLPGGGAGARVGRGGCRARDPRGRPAGSAFAQPAPRAPPGRAGTIAPPPVTPPSRARRPAAAARRVRGPGRRLRGREQRPRARGAPAGAAGRGQGAALRGQPRHLVAGAGRRVRRANWRRASAAAAFEELGPRRLRRSGRLARLAAAAPATAGGTPGGVGQLLHLPVGKQLPRVDVGEQPAHQPRVQSCPLRTADQVARAPGSRAAPGPRGSRGSCAARIRPESAARRG